MMKITGVFLIVGTTTLFGMESAKQLKKQLEDLQHLQQILYLLQSEIRYSRAFLSEIFFQISQKVEEPYKTWLFTMSKEANAFTGKTLEIIWKKGIDKHLKMLNLPSNEHEELKILGGQLGMADVQVQVRLLDLHIEHLERTMKNLRESMKTKVKLYHCLGIMSGLFISVLLL